ncbi:MAG: hydroxymethylbilane synthase [Pirellulales bacterium]
MPTSRSLRIGTRGSKLARWQAEWVAARLQQHGQPVELVEVTTSGDSDQHGSIEAIGTLGVFTKEIQRALLVKDVDIAVHSLKDLPTEPVDGLILAATPPRESVCDALISNDFASVAELPQRARVGTGSLRRQAQLRFLRPDLQLLDIRGNVDTRIAKLDAGEYDAIVLAEAGLNRLGLVDRIRELLTPDRMLSAVGQGALGIECRADDRTVLDNVSRINDAETFAAVAAERALLAGLQGGCLAAIGAWGRVEEGQLVLSAVVLSPDGLQRLFHEDRAAKSEAIELGARVAEVLRGRGAAELLQR